MLNHKIIRKIIPPIKSKNLPNKILRAIDNAMHLSVLKRNARITLAEICRFVSQKEPFSTIFPRKAYMAKRLNLCERTIYRHLKLLAKENLIKISTQERKSLNGRFAIARIQLTHKAAVLLGFLEDKTLVTHSRPSDNLSDGLILTKPTNTMNQLSETKITNGLPQSLGWLTGNGLRREGIFKLMGIATKNKKRLSDITLVAHKHIKNLKGGQLYAYLHKLAHGPSDFSILAANKRKRLAKALEEYHQHKQISMFRSRFRKMAFTNRAQTKLFLIDEQARFAQIFTQDSNGTMPLNNLLVWMQAINSGKLVLATLETKMRLLRQ